MFSDFKCDKNINEVIRKTFEKRSKLKSAERSLDCIKSLNPNKFLPCRAVSNILKGHGLLQKYTKLHIWHIQYLTTLQ